MPTPELRSPVARAVVPVAAGAVFIAVLFGVLWVAAVILSRNADDLDVRLGDDVFTVGRVDDLADEIEESGPLLFPGLVGPAGRRPVGLDHTGGNDFAGWRVFSLVPRGAPQSCVVSQNDETGTLADCDGRPVDVDDLPPAQDVQLIIEADSGRVVLDLRSATTTTTAE
jgi:hypothetical protein